MKKLTIKTMLFMLLFSCGSKVIFADSTEEVIQCISVRVSQIREGKRDRTLEEEFAGKVTDASLEHVDPQKVLAFLNNYENEESWEGRHFVLWCQWRLAVLHPQKDIRQDVTESLVKAYIDQNSGMASHASKWLVSFCEDDFSEVTRSLIIERFHQVKEEVEKANQNQTKDNCVTDKIFDRGLIYICGIANIKELFPDLENLLIDEWEYKKQAGKFGKKWYYTTGFAVRLVRARMGAHEDIVQCIALIKAEHPHVQTLHLLEKLSYMRQPEAVELIKVSFLNSEDRLPATKPTAIGTPYYRFAIGALANCLEGFPVLRKESRNYTAEEVELCRKWMSEQKEWNIIR